MDGSYAFAPRLSSRIRMNVRRVEIVCQPWEYESRAPSDLYIRQCSSVRNCSTSTEYQSAPPTATTDRVCLPLSPACALGPAYQLQAPTPTSDRVCLSCLNGTSLAAVSAYAPPRAIPCDNVTAPVVEQGLTWNAATAVIVPPPPPPPPVDPNTGLRPPPPPSPPPPAVPPVVIYVGDTVAWTFNTSNAAIRSRSSPAVFDSRRVVNSTSVANSTNAPFGTFRFTFNSTGRFDYDNPFNSSWRGAVLVRPRPTLPACNLNITGELQWGTLGMQALSAQVAADFRAWRRLLPVVLPTMDEDVRGLCQNMRLDVLARVLHNTTYSMDDNGNAVSVVPPLGNTLRFVKLNQSFGYFEVRQPGADTSAGRQWTRVPAAVNSSSPFSVQLQTNGVPAEMRFVSVQNFFGTVNLTWLLPDQPEFLAEGILTIAPINDPPVIGTTVEFPDIDEDPPSDQLEGTLISGE